MNIERIFFKYSVLGGGGGGGGGGSFGKKWDWVKFRLDLLGIGWSDCLRQNAVSNWAESKFYLRE